MESSPKPVVKFCNGASLTIEPRFTAILAGNTKFQIFAILSIAFFALIRPYGAQAALEKWQSSLIIFTMGAIVFALYGLFFTLLDRFGARVGIRRIHTVWIVLLTSFIGTFLGDWSVSIFDGPRLPFDQKLFIWAFNFAIFSGLEVFFSILILPDLIRRMELSDTSEPRLQSPQVFDPQPPASPSALEQNESASEIRVVTVSDKRFPAQFIRSVSSQGHYISITTFRGKNYFVRGRLRDFLEQIPEEMGYCIHRSHWVSWTGIERVNVANDNMLVCLDDDTTLPVARGRRSDFIERWNRRSQVN